jgi:non-canonical poly(A) RNA polymerase PAPD5/7
MTHQPLPMNTPPQLSSLLSIKDINKELNLKRFPNQNTSNLTLSIPVEITSSPQTNIPTQSLGSFLDISNSPLLSIDLNTNEFQLEIELNNLLQQLNDKNEEIKQCEKNIQDSDKKIKELTAKLKEKETNLNYYKSLEITNAQKIQEMADKKNNLMQTIPRNHLEQNPKKNLPPKEYGEAKFNIPTINESYIIKTLQHDLLDYLAYIKNETSLKQNVIEQAYNAISQLIQQIFPDFTILKYGSYATNLNMPWSGLDLIITKPNEKFNEMQMRIILAKLHEIFKNQAWVSEIKFQDFNWAPILIIRTTPETGNILMTITPETENNKGLECIELINSYLKEYTILEPIIIALKTILKNANLNDPGTGGLSSYGLILMVVSYLQSLIDKNIPFLEGDDIIGKIFYDFLQHYGLVFDYNNYVILTYPLNRDTPEQFDKMIIGNSSEFIIVDPLDNMNNVAKNNSQFMNLKMAFMIAYMVSKEDCECGCHYGRAPQEYAIELTEHCILKRMFNSVKRFSDSK